MNPGSDAGAERLLAKAEYEISSGRLWRAREMLEGSIRAYPTDVRILERYGRLLDELGDRVQGGKYLFLSGVRGPDVEDAIGLFIGRHGKGHLNNLIAQFPGEVRRLGLGSFPAVVKADLERLGLPEVQVRTDTFDAVPASWGLRDNLLMFGCGLVTIGIAVSAVVGVGTILGWVFAS